MRLTAHALAAVVCTAPLAVADAAEVVWPTPPDPALAAEVATAAGASRGALKPVDLRAATAAWGPTDDAAIDALEATLRDVREYETQLDGELIIMADLGPAIAEITMLRDPDDAQRVYAALAYQGFAVDRFFADQLGDDERADGYRATISEQLVEQPWLDAVALQPDRDITPYEIAEAPQRVAFSAVQDVVTGALPARLVPPELPDGAELFVDGQQRELDRTGNLELAPGRHFVHVLYKGIALARWDLRLAEAERKELRLPIDEAAWSAWIDAFVQGEDPPAELPVGVGEAVEALGGEVWLARSTDARKVQVWKVTPQGATADTVKLETPSTDGGSGPFSPSLWVDASYGWLTSGDFYAQNPVETERTRATVNAGAPGFGVGLDADIAILRVGAGVNVMVPTGEDHVALTGDDTVRARPYLHARVGLKPVQATVGYVLPYHLGVGGAAQIPLVAGVELHAGGLWGPAPSAQRSDGTTWEGHALGAAWAGLGWRLGG